MNDKKIKNLLRAFVASILVFVVLLSAVVFAGSYQLGIQDKRNQDNYTQIVKELTSLKSQIVTEDELAAVIARIPTPKDGVNGTNGANGTNGKDSLSTHTVTKENTVIEREVTIIKETPQDGKNGENPSIALTADGRWLYKYSTDREWNLVPIINLEVDL